MTDHKYYTDYTVERYLCGSWVINPEVDAAWYYSMLRKHLGSGVLTDFDIRIERGDQGDDEMIRLIPDSDGLRFSFTVTAKSRKSARKKADDLFSGLTALPLGVFPANAHVLPASPSEIILPVTPTLQGCVKHEHVLPVLAGQLEVTFHLRLLHREFQRPERPQDVIALILGFPLLLLDVGAVFRVDLQRVICHHLLLRSSRTVYLLY